PLRQHEQGLPLEPEPNLDLPGLAAHAPGCGQVAVVLVGERTHRAIQADRRWRRERLRGNTAIKRQGNMNDNAKKISGLLHEVGERHDTVFRITDGADDDWASWYSDWLVNHSELADLLGKAPVRSELTYMLVKLDQDYTAESPDEPWPDWYASRLIDHFA